MYAYKEAEIIYAPLFACFELIRIMISVDCLKMGNRRNLGKITRAVCMVYIPKLSE